MRPLRPRGAACRRALFAACALACAALPGAAWAQAAAPWDIPAHPPHLQTSAAAAARAGVVGAKVPEAPGGSTLGPDGTVQVFKHLGGPALWKAVQGDSQVFILGAATPLPHLLQWNTLRVENALNGADALYLEPRPSFSPFELMRLAVDKGPLQLPRGQTLETVLPLPEKARYLHLVALIHGKTGTYNHWKPAVAGLFLIADWRKAAGLSEGKPGTTVMHLADDAHVPVQYVGDFKLDPYVATVGKLSMADNIACFDAAMDDVDRESAHVPAMAKAWADADLKTVGETYKVSLLTGCLQRIPSVEGLLDRGTEEAVRTIQLALLKPGKSVAVVDLNFLLRAGGVLDRLKAQGVQVSVPD
jgi:uncharacterized protein YbaP (TraB family)